MSPVIAVQLSSRDKALHSSLWRRRTLKYPDRRGERGAGDGADGFAGTDGGCGELVGRADVGIRNDLAFDQPIAEESYHFGTGRELTVTQCIAVSQRGQIENANGLRANSDADDNASDREIIENHLGRVLDVLEITSDIDLRISGFAMGEIDVALSLPGEDEEDVLPALNEPSAFTVSWLRRRMASENFRPASVFIQS